MTIFAFKTKQLLPYATTAPPAYHSLSGCKCPTLSSASSLQSAHPVFASHHGKRPLAKPHHLHPARPPRTHLVWHPQRTLPLQRLRLPAIPAQHQRQHVAARQLHPLTLSGPSGPHLDRHRQGRVPLPYRKQRLPALWRHDRTGTFHRSACRRQHLLLVGNTLRHRHQPTAARSSHHARRADSHQRN